MAFTKNYIVGNTTATSSTLNTDFNEIYTELTTFPTTNGDWAPGGVSANAIKAGTITWSYLKAMLTDYLGLNQGDLTTETDAFPYASEAKGYIDDQFQTVTNFGGAYQNGTITMTGTYQDVPLFQTYGQNDTGDGESFTIYTVGTYAIHARANWLWYPNTTVSMRVLKDTTPIATIDLDATDASKHDNGKTYHVTTAIITSASLDAGEQLSVQVKSTIQGTNRSDIRNGQNGVQIHWSIT
jgi:hypothetical protein